MKKFIMFTLALTMTLFLAACGGDSADKEKEEQEANQDIEMSEDEKVDADKVVVNINGDEVNGQTYNELYAQTKAILGRQGQDVSDKESLKDQVLNAIIERELLIKEAEEEGIDITEEDVKVFKTENEEQYKAVLEQYNLSEEEYDEQLSFELLLDKYISSVYPISEVTDEEVQKLYDEVKEENEDIPEIDEVEDQLREMHVMQKLGEKIEKLKDEAEIETMM